MSKRWSADEDEYLRQERLAGASVMSMALTLGRTYDAVAKRLELMRKRERDAEQIQHEKRRGELISELPLDLEKSAFPAS